MFASFKPTTRHSTLPPWLRVVAWACATLVLLLSLASVSPQLHSELHASCDHGHCHDDAPAPSTDHDHDCAVTLFAQGVALFAQFSALSAPFFQELPSVCRLPEKPALPRPHALTPPAHAPPFWSAAA